MSGGRRAAHGHPQPRPGARASPRHRRWRTRCRAAAPRPRRRPAALLRTPRPGTPERRAREPTGASGPARPPKAAQRRLGRRGQRRRCPAAPPALAEQRRGRAAPPRPCGRALNLHWARAQPHSTRARRSSLETCRRIGPRVSLAASRVSWARRKPGRGLRDVCVGPGRHPVAPCSLHAPNAVCGQVARRAPAARAEHLDGGSHCPVVPLTQHKPWRQSSRRLT